MARFNIPCTELAALFPDHNCTFQGTTIRLDDGYHRGIVVSSLDSISGFTFDLKRDGRLYNIEVCELRDGQVRNADSILQHIGKEVQGFVNTAIAKFATKSSRGDTLDIAEGFLQCVHVGTFRVDGSDIAVIAYGAKSDPWLSVRNWKSQRHWPVDFWYDMQVSIGIRHRPHDVPFICFEIKHGAIKCSFISGPMYLRIIKAVLETDVFPDEETAVQCREYVRVHSKSKAKHSKKPIKFQITQ
ncbi:hypothetical protein [Alicyclobacillus macrosporangiidus]|uniref:Uncharacterized protein n=1 Tax=Alicyclobacillus macrosporangiidus TaxID=392015 RepID=A0A1I7LEI2_9BACL|nr:hypothetical protein [Alicyclobacillus macrosporangiidus]SFV08085.1 hypothetical protein SAMN05421543_14115 [Alicyclobacillus macrosporangiidus]